MHARPEASGVRAQQLSQSRPRPGITEDNQFFFEGAAIGELRIQQCSACAVLQHPPAPMCGSCGSFDLTAVVSSGRGVVYTFTITQHPVIPAFEHPFVVAVVELEEGTRLVTNIVGCQPSEIRIGMPVEVEFAQIDDTLTLPLFHPAPADRRPGDTRS